MKAPKEQKTNKYKKRGFESQLFGLGSQFNTLVFLLGNLRETERERDLQSSATGVELSTVMKLVVTISSQLS